MSNRSVLIIIIILAIIVGVFAFMNSEIANDNKEIQENAEVLLKEDNKEIKKYDYDEIIQLSQVEFAAVLDTSDSDPKDHIYTGIPLKNLIEDAGISIEDKEQIIVRGVDGYTVALNPKEVLEEDNVYLAYKIDGETLGLKSEGGSGPYQLIIKNDLFSQRWCKYVTEIELK